MTRLDLKQILKDKKIDTEKLLNEKPYLFLSIMDALRDAYNKGVNDSLENVELYYTDLEQTEQDINKESIFKLLIK